MVLDLKLTKYINKRLIIKKNGENAVFHIADENEYYYSLFIKIKEETIELYNSKTKEELQEELADLYEILDTLTILHGFTKKEISLIQENKRNEKGGFEKKIILEVS